MNDKMLDSIEKVRKMIDEIDTSDWPPFEVRSVKGSSIGITKEKDAIYILTDNEWIRSMEIYRGNQFTEKFN